MMSRLLLRLIVGGSFVGHGTQKLFGWFGGSGRTAATWFEQFGLRPGAKQAIAAGVAEASAGAGALILIGLATPLAASAVTATMLMAIDQRASEEGRAVVRNRVATLLGGNLTAAHVAGWN
jgi:putative oxidoreductase